MIWTVARLAVSGRMGLCAHRVLRPAAASVESLLIPAVMPALKRFAYSAL